MKKVFVSGCYDIIHAGHIQFFQEARALGNHLTVCFASSEVLSLAKQRVSALPDSHKAAVIGSLRCVDRVVTSSDLDPIFDFESHWKKESPDILAVTEDDKNTEKKQELCKEYGVELVVLKKTPPPADPRERVSTTSIRARIRNIQEVPLRVDFAGGWLDVPKLSKKGAFIVNCTISPKVSLNEWPYEKSAGLGGSAAFAILEMRSGVKSELNLGVGWQDPAVISETGLCVWRSGRTPVLEAKYNPDWLEGKLLIVWTGRGHLTPGLVKHTRDYGLIKRAGLLAAEAVAERDLKKLASAISQSYKAQLGEGMERLPHIASSLAFKYLGGGHGGYALYLFPSKKSRDTAARKNPAAKIIEPYIESDLG